MKLSAICSDVTEVVLESLDAEKSGAIPLTTNLVDELEAESLDFLDIVFRLEKRFDVKIERGKMEKNLRRQFPNLTLKPNTPLDDDLRSALQEMLPEIPADQVRGLQRLKDSARTFRIATFVRLTVQSLEESGRSVDADVTSVDGYSPQQLGVGSSATEQHRAGRSAGASAAAAD
jgi:acyl carrier protein